MVSVPEMARHRKNPCLPVVHPTPIKQWNGGAEHPGLLDGLPFRWVSTVAALPVRTPGAKLFKGLGGYYCRPCVGNPIYASQGKSTQNRRHFEACKLRLRLNGNASLAEPFPTRQRGMHRSTYARLRRRGEALEAGLSARFKTKPPDYPNLIYYLSFA
jgi:hypothetical protein